MQLSRFDRALTSPAPAARETAAALAPDADADDGLRDLDIGCWAGLTLGALAEQSADEVSAWLADPAYAGHGGESLEALVHRTSSWLAGRQDTGGATLAVTHAFVVRAAIVATLGAPATNLWPIDVAPLTLLTLGSDGRRWTLREIRAP